MLVVAAGPAAAQTVRVVKLPALLTLLALPTDTTYVVNFWATWCKPCVEELPGFEALRAASVGQKVRVVLVSLDFPSQLQKKVEPFVAQKKLASDVWLLAESDANQFIDKIEPTWSGAIPFTIVVNNARQRRRVFERPITLLELQAAVDEARR